MGEIDVQIQKEYGGGKSKLRAYQDLVVGSPSLFFLLLFETITQIAPFFGSWRTVLYGAILGAKGAKTHFGSRIVFRHPKKIIIGDQCRIGAKALIDAKGFTNRGIIMGDRCFIGDESVLSCKEGDISLGDGVTLGARCNISSNSSITIGSGTTLGDAATLFATSHNFDKTDTAVLDQGWTSKGIIVGSQCKLGDRVVVTDGVTIGNNVTVAAGSVVTKDLADGLHVAGAPAKPV